MLYSDVEANSVLLVADDDTTSTASPTRRGAHEKTHGMRDRRRNVYVSLEVWMLWLCSSFSLEDRFFPRVGHIKPAGMDKVVACGLGYRCAREAT